MGEIEFRGEGALDSANALITNDLKRIADGQAVYAGLLNHQGGFVDDVVAYRFSPERILICVNASNREKDFAWMVENSPRRAARQPERRLRPARHPGPEGGGHRPAADPDSAGRRSPPTTSGKARWPACRCIISRTGYTGEDGFELYCPPERAERLWNALLEAGSGDGLQPRRAGRADTLRTEMKYALYGNDIDDATHAAGGGAGLDRQVGQGRVRRSPRARRAEGARACRRKLVGFEMREAGIPATATRWPRTASRWVR